jgi:hypothetical protein
MFDDFCKMIRDLYNKDEKPVDIEALKMIIGGLKKSQ